MSDETDTTSEVARVLSEHLGFYLREDWPRDDWYVCDPCGVELETDPKCVAEAFHHHQADELAKAGLLRPQIAAQEPAGATQGGSGGSRAVGGLDGAPAGNLGSQLRFAALTMPPEQHRWMTDLSIQADRMEQERDGARIKGEQWKARYEETRDANRRVQDLAQWFRGQGLVGYARKVEEAVGGVASSPCVEGAVHSWRCTTATSSTAPAVWTCTLCGTATGTAPEPVSENPFRMPEDRG